jgi:hypothetical protein
MIQHLVSIKSGTLVRSLGPKHLEDTALLEKYIYLQCLIYSLMYFSCL